MNNPILSPNNTASKFMAFNESMLLRSLLEGTGEWAVIVLDAGAVIQTANSMAGSLIKRPPGQLIGLNFFELVDLQELNGSFVKDEENPVYKILHSNYRQVQPFFCWYTPIGGERLTLALRVVAVPDGTGTGAGGGVIVYLREAQRKFDPKSVDRSFVSFAAHQLKTPAGAVQGFLEMVLRDVSAFENHPRAYGYIISAYEANLSLIRSAKDLLNSAKLRGGLIEPDIKSFDLVQTLEQKLKSHEQWMTSKRIQLRTDYQLESRVSVSSDRAIVSELFDILFHNALKYSNPASVIHLSVKREGNLFKIAVADEGPGLAEAQSKIGDELSGSGMGLKVARQYASLLKGKINYKEVHPKGSCFELELPDFT